MNPLQRLLSNALLAFISNAVARVSNSILFIFIGRLIGPSDAGSFTLGITYYTIILALSTWGLHELLVREVARRRRLSSHYLLNYVVMRLVLSVAWYALLLLFLRANLPYSETTRQIIRLIALAVFPEAIFSLCQSLFVAHERLAPPTFAALLSSAVKLGGGFWLLSVGAGPIAIAWLIPISAFAGLLVMPPALGRLFATIDSERPAGLSWTFMREQLQATPGFILLALFATLDFQADTFIISLLMSERDIGWYGAAQTLVMGLSMIPLAVRTALFPLMTRYRVESAARLQKLYRKANQYLLTAVLPIAAGLTLLAGPIINLIFTDSFEPAAVALRWMSWSLLFTFLTVPSARLLLVEDRQQLAGWLRGAAMLTSIALNLLLIPRFGLTGAAAARVGATAVFFVATFGFVHRTYVADGALLRSWRPLLGTIVMAIAVWPLRSQPLLWPLFTGVVVYAGAILLLGAVNADDRRYLRQLLQMRAR